MDVKKDGNLWLMHNKIMIIDQEKIVFGSANFTQKASSINDKFQILVNNPILSRSFVKRHKLIYSQGTEDPPDASPLPDTTCPSAVTNVRVSNTVNGYK